MDELDKLRRACSESEPLNDRSCGDDRQWAVGEIARLRAENMRLDGSTP